MKKSFVSLVWILIFTLLLSSCNITTDKQNQTNTPNDTDTSNGENSTEGKPDDTPCTGHIDEDDDEFCDSCGDSIFYVFSIYSFNDLHGVFSETDSNIGAGRLATYLKTVAKENSIILSTGDTWQGSSESNLTYGNIMTEWMNDLGVTSMTLGNHEFDWGEDKIEENSNLADFPFLAINVYDKDTNARVSYAKPSVTVDLGEIQVGIIGAIGNCYSSISGEVSGGFYFKTGSELTALVKTESERLRSNGVDFIVYALHDGHDRSSTSGYISDTDLSLYYDIALSDGYVDLVFEAHTHKNYIYKDTKNVYHIQGGGYNSAVSKVDISVNLITGKIKPSATNISSSLYKGMQVDSKINELLVKYEDEIAKANEVLGILPSGMNSTVLRQLVADLYLDAGMEEWGKYYSITLGGGFLSVRNPYELSAGEVEYRDLQAILPFDNEIVLCSIKGYKLLSQFINTDNSNYFISMNDAWKDVTINPNETYYVVVDTYTSTYAYNGLTEIDRYDSGVYARDLLAEYIKNNY